MADISRIRNGEKMTNRELIALTAKLSLPAIMAQLSSILMQYIDAAMVGRLGADPSAAIGLVSTSLWLSWGICSAMTVGFSVQVAHRLGAKDEEGARKILRQSITASIIFSVVVSAIAMAVSKPLPIWLGGTDAINHLASTYFFIFVAALPGLTLNFLAGGMLRCAGNMKVPSLLNAMMAVLDICFNFFLIFPEHNISIGSVSFVLPGANLGITGAALGTVAAELVTAFFMMTYLLTRQKELRLKGTSGTFRPDRKVIRKALTISAPMTLEHAVICGAQIMITVIVAPLGVVAIAANAFAVTAESLCYMPGYGIGDAATTLVGQSFGAGRPTLVRRFGWITVGVGMAVMSLMGLLMWFGAPWMMDLMTPVKDISSLGVDILRIEAWAEPMFAASIVAYGVFIGTGDTLVPACMNFGSIWLVRLPIAAILAPRIGLKGVWIAMCVELCFRGLIFLIRLHGNKWNRNKKSDAITQEQISSYEDSFDGGGQNLN